MTIPGLSAVSLRSEDSSKPHDPHNPSLQPLSGRMVPGSLCPGHRSGPDGAVPGPSGHSDAGQRGLASPGIPRGPGGSLKLPLYLAVGIPIEAYVMLEPVKQNPIFDAIATILNVTGDSEAMVAAAILTRGDRASSRN